MRLVDKQLHQYLEKHRQLAEKLIGILEVSRAETGASCAFLVEDTGQIIISRGEVTGVSPAMLGKLAVDGLALDGDVKKLLEQAQSQGDRYRLEQEHGIYVIFVTENLFLVLVLPVTADLHRPAEIWPPVETVAGQVKTALYEQVASGVSPANDRSDSPPRLFIPLPRKLDDGFSPPPDAEPHAQDENEISWEIVSGTSSLWSRMDKYCRRD